MRGQYALSEHVGLTIGANRDGARSCAAVAGWRTVRGCEAAAVPGLWTACEHCVGAPSMGTSAATRRARSSDNPSPTMTHRLPDDCTENRRCRCRRRARLSSSASWSPASARDSCGRMSRGAVSGPQRIGPPRDDLPTQRPASVAAAEWPGARRQRALVRPHCRAPEPSRQVSGHGIRRTPRAASWIAGANAQPGRV